MNVIALISAILFGTITPLPVDFPEGIKAGVALSVDGYVLAAVIPDVVIGYEEKTTLLENAAESLATALGKKVILTQDLLTYLILLRIEKRGADRYERENLAARILNHRDNCIHAISQSGFEGTNHITTNISGL